MAGDRKLPGWLLPTLGGVVVVALVAAGVLRDAPELDPSTPEGTVQAYLEAVFDGDQEAAAALTEGECDTNLGPGIQVEGVSATLKSVEGDENQATVIVKMSQPSTEPFGGLSEWEEWFSLLNHDGTWMIQQQVWPYYAGEC
jgi:hypothetical protein